MIMVVQRTNHRSLVWRLFLFVTSCETDILSKVLERERALWENINESVLSGKGARPSPNDELDQASKRMKLSEPVAPITMRVGANIDNTSESSKQALGREMPRRSVRAVHLTLTSAESKSSKTRKNDQPQDFAKVSCPVCKGFPFHFRYLCPVIQAGIPAIETRLIELKMKGSNAELVQELEEIVHRKRAKESLNVSRTEDVEQPISPQKSPATDDIVAENAPMAVVRPKNSILDLIPLDSDDSEDDSDNNESIISQDYLEEQEEQRRARHNKRQAAMRQALSPDFVPGWQEESDNDNNSSQRSSVLVNDFPHSVPIVERSRGEEEKDLQV